LQTRPSVGVLAMLEAQTTNAIEVAHAWLEHLAHCLEIAQANGEGGMTDQGWKKSLDEQRHLIGEVLGLFASAGVAKSTLPRCVHAEDLVYGILEDLERIALSKGGMMQVLLDKRVKLYKINVERFSERMAA
jgi:hypothetical protein